MANDSAGLLLDTHCWIWLESGDGEQFSEGGLAAVDDARRRGDLLVSVISVWELAMLEAKGASGSTCHASNGYPKLWPPQASRLRR